MTFQESGAYPLLHPYDITDQSTTNGPWLGVVRMGPQQRAYELTMWHQLHCIRILRTAFMPSSPGVKDEHLHYHVHHCLDRFRQHWLCDADLTLEPSNFMTANFSDVRVHPPRKCNNWQALYSNTERNFVDWRRHAIRNVR